MFYKENINKYLKKTIILLVVFFILLLGLIVWYFINSNNNQIDITNNLNSINKIEVKMIENDNILVKQGDDWVLSNLHNQPVAKEKIDKVITTLDELKLNEIVSKNPDKKSVYKVDDTGIEVVLNKDDKIIGHFWIGKYGPTWPSTYLRMENSNDVYLIRQDLLSTFGLFEWRDMGMVALSEDEINELIWDNGLNIVKQDSTWQVVRPKQFVIDKEKISTVLDNIANLQANDIANFKADQLDENKLSFILEVITEEQNYKLFFWQNTDNKEDNDYYVVVEGNNTVYELTKYVAENLEKKIEYLK